ncbi:MAG: hypothetical protein JO235_22240 [Chroococcidiopsidaceae cyanobacterium CP_BM_RX_35]|nr:hypothetical protein [Chroococcidiopsidaceae cyanobacterium CP_BM_RX_35]
MGDAVDSQQEIGTSKVTIASLIERLNRAEAALNGKGTATAPISLQFLCQSHD